jgi:hypothetical protein
MNPPGSPFNNNKRWVAVEFDTWNRFALRFNRLRKDADSVSMGVDSCSQALKTQMEISSMKSLVIKNKDLSIQDKNDEIASAMYTEKRQNKTINRQKGAVFGLGSVCIILLAIVVVGR